MPKGLSTKKESNKVEEDTPAIVIRESNLAEVISTKTEKEQVDILWHMLGQAQLNGNIRLWDALCIAIEFTGSDEYTCIGEEHPTTLAEE